VCRAVVALKGASARLTCKHLQLHADLLVMSVPQRGAVLGKGLIGDPYNEVNE